MIALLLAIFPALGLFLLLLRLHPDHAIRISPMPWIMLGLGVLSAVPAIALEIFLNRALNYELIYFISSILMYAMGVVAFSEEISKYLLFRIMLFKRPVFHGRYDAILYVAASSLGFALIENMKYAMGGGIATAWVRMYTAVPAHFSFGIAMGYFIGIGKFPAAGKKATWFPHVIGIALAVILHGLYDFFLFLAEKGQLPPGTGQSLSMAVLGTGILLSIFFIQAHLKHTKSAFAHDPEYGHQLRRTDLLTNQEEIELEDTNQDLPIARPPEDDLFSEKPVT